jgi:glutamine synthetase
MTPKQILQMIKDKGATSVDLKFMDLLGQWQHFSTPISEFQDESPFDEGLGFDGSSIRGWQSIDNSDMLVIPDPSTAVMEPFTKEPTLHDLRHLRPDHPKETPISGKCARDGSCRD